MSAQVIQSVSNATISTTSTVYAPTSLSVTITPRSTNSKILVSVSGGAAGVFDNADYAGYAAIVRNGALNLGGAALSIRSSSPAGNVMSSVSIQSLDAPASVGSVTYTFYMKSSSGNTVYANFAGSTSLTMTALELPM